jgi:glycosyltransferase involved in cell wall biosynthesis
VPTRPPEWAEDVHLPPALDESRSRMRKITLNGRFYSHPHPTGMQRYALELVSRIGTGLEPIRPGKSLKGAMGHLWEQAYLPIASRNSLLWSPNNTGPVTVSRQVITIHDLIPLDHPEWFSPRFVTLYRWLLPRLVNKAQHLIAISEFTRMRLIDGLHVDPAKISVVPNGVDKSFTPQAPERIARVREALALGDKPYVLCVGSVEPRKNLKGLLAAWSQLPANVRQEYSLVLAGKRGRKEVFGDAGLDNVPEGAIFTGYVAQDDLPALYSGAAIFAYPSLYEGFGLPPLEAMASGVPVLTSNNSSIPEVVGDAGVLIDPQEPESIAHGLFRLMSEERLRNTLAQRGMERAKALSWDATAEQTWAILQREAAI